MNKNKITYGLNLYGLKEINAVRDSLKKNYINGKKCFKAFFY